MECTVYNKKWKVGVIMKSKEQRLWKVGEELTLKVIFIQLWKEGATKWTNKVRLFMIYVCFDYAPIHSRCPINSAKHLAYSDG